MIAPDLQSQDKAVVPEMPSSRSKIFKQKLFLLSLAFLFLAAIVFFFTTPIPKSSVSPQKKLITSEGINIPLSPATLSPTSTSGLQTKLENVIIKDNTVTGTLKIENTTDTPVSDIFYSLKVLGSTMIPPASSSAYIRSQEDIAAFSSSQTFTLAAHATKNASFTLPYSPQITDGSYALKAWVLDTNQDPLSSDDKEVKLSGTNQYVFVNYPSCKILVNNIPFDSNIGTLIRPSDKGIIQCQVKNTGKSVVTIYPMFTIAERFVLDFPYSSPHTETNPTPVKLAPNEEKTVSVPIPFQSKPQVYEGLLSFTDKGQQNNSFYYRFRWTTPGESAYIQDAKPDKTSYKKGETAKVKLTTAASMDLFWQFNDPRNQAGTTIKNPTITTTLLSGNAVCGSATIPMKQDRNKITQEASLNILQDCTNPTVKTTVQDGDGKMLAQKSQETLSGLPSAPNTLNTIFVAVLLITSLIFLTIAVIRLLTKKDISMFIAVLLFYLGLFVLLIFALIIITGAFPGKVFADNQISTLPGSVAVNRVLNFIDIYGGAHVVPEEATLSYTNIIVTPLTDMVVVQIKGLKTTTPVGCQNQFSVTAIKTALDTTYDSGNTIITWFNGPGTVNPSTSSNIEYNTSNNPMDVTLHITGLGSGNTYSQGSHFLKLRFISKNTHGPYGPNVVLGYPTTALSAYSQSDHNYLEYQQSWSPNFYYSTGWNCFPSYGMTPCYGEYMFPWGDLPAPSPSIPPPNLDPIGYQGLETGCDQFVGWACDGDDHSVPINVDFHRSAAGGGLPTVYVGQTTTNQAWDDASKAICDGYDHGYRMLTPLELKNGNTYDIYAYGINIGTGNNSLLGNSPRRITCAAPTPPPTPIPPPTPPPSPTPPPVPPVVNLSLTTPNGTFIAGTGLLFVPVNQNAVATLNWSITSDTPITSANASSNPVQGYWSGAGWPVSGSQGITTTSTGTFVFTLTAANAAGPTVKSIQVNIDKYPPPFIQTTGGDVHSNETIYITPLPP